MAGRTRQQIEVAKQFRRALALDLVEDGAPAAYELLKLTVKNALIGLRDGSAPIPSRQAIDSSKALLLMSGMSERVIDPDQAVNLSKLSLRELEAMIADLKVIDLAPNADNAAASNTEDLDMFK